MEIAEIQKLVHATAVEKGFHDDFSPTFGEKGRSTRHILSWLMLVITEVQEAWGEYTDHPHFAEELADVVIRLLDAVEALGLTLDLSRAMIPKDVSLMGVVVQVAKAAEGARKGNVDLFKNHVERAIITAFELARINDHNLEEAILDKMTANKSRDKMHGGKLA